LAARLQLAAALQAGAAGICVQQRGSLAADGEVLLVLRRAQAGAGRLRVAGHWCWCRLVLQQGQIRS
jgi:hypothetical protein